MWSTDVEVGFLAYFCNLILHVQCLLLNHLYFFYISSFSLSVVRQYMIYLYSCPLKLDGLSYLMCLHDTI